MSFITPLFAYATVALLAAFVYVLLALIFKKTWGRESIEWTGKHSMLLGLLVSLGAFIGSLIYSQILGYEPCELCWWQRICLFPLVAIFGIGLYKKDKQAFGYAFPLALVGGIIALYHMYIQLGGTTSILPCTAVGGACAKVYVLALGFVTIPTMSLVIALSILLLAYIHHDYNRHA